MFLLERWLPRRLNWLALAGHGVAALAILLGLRLFHASVDEQFQRLALVIRQGLSFATPECTTGFCDTTMFWLAGSIIRHAGAGVLYDHARYVAYAAAHLPYHSG
jgi:hypothetical protein